MASASDTTWNCTRCTFQQSAFNDKCEICGEANTTHKKQTQPKLNANTQALQPSTRYGRIMYQVDRLTTLQLTATHSLYQQQPDAASSSWPVYLFGDNDIDHGRPPSTDREMLGGLGTQLHSSYTTHQKIQKFSLTN